MNIYVIYPASEGLQKYRFVEPHQALKKQYSESYDVKYDPIDKIHKDSIDWADVIYISWTSLLNDGLYNLIKKCRSEGKYVVCDIDDYWKKPVYSKDYYAFMLSGAARSKKELIYMVKSNIKNVKNVNKQIEQKFKARIKTYDSVVASTEFLANKLRMYHDDVEVISNGLSEFDVDTIKHNESDKFRVFWGGGSSHFDDLCLLNGLYTYCVDNIPDFQFVMAGYSNKIRDRKTGKITESEQGTVWKMYESIVTDGFYKLPKEYTEFLLKIRKENWYDEHNVSYIRRWAKPVSRYLTMYKDSDVVLAPLVKSTFNRCKSELKIIEAGMAKKPIIVSNLDPYSQIEHKYTGMVVNEFKSYSNKANKKWQESVQYLYDNPTLRVEMGESLYGLVKENFSYDKLTQKRNYFYESINELV